MDKLYSYRKILKGAGSKTLILDGERTFIEKYISGSEFAALFGGFLISKDMGRADSSSQYIGVWGSRLTQKFKRILRERGAEFEVCEIDSGERSVMRMTQNFLHGTN